jgi:hypothetical protein
MNDEADDMEFAMNNLFLDLAYERMDFKYKDLV